MPCSIALMKNLPDKIRRALENTGKRTLDGIREIRIKRNSPLCVTLKEGLFFVSPAGELCSHREAFRVSSDELNETVKRFCKGSVYSFESCIRSGYIPAERGVRVGVCAEARQSPSGDTCLLGIDSLCIRIPARVIGAAAPLLSLYKAKGLSGTLIFSAPGGGKTTVLRELAAELSYGALGNYLRIAVIDERCEIDIDGCLELCDVYSGYAKARGIELAVRTMSPQAVICDEIGASEADALVASQTAGVPLIASVHGKSKEELITAPFVKKLLSSGAFRYLYDVEKKTVHEL